MPFFAMAMRPTNRGLSKARSQRGYILITLIFFVAILVIAALAIAPSIIFEAKRDREEEMVHRGVQYSRAIGKFVKKSGHFPNRLEDLENTNQVRFLRKRYKDPITGKDFKVLHQGEVQLIPGAQGLAGANPLGAAGGLGLAGGQAGPQQAAAQIAQGLAAGQGAQGGGQTGLFGSSPPASAGDDATVFPDNGAAQSGQTGLGQNTPSGASSGFGASGATGQPGQPGQAGSGPLGTQAGANGQTFGGGAIVGVVSTSKAKSIRIFNKKDHYNDWQFIYNPQSGGSGLLNAPGVPVFQGTANNNGLQPNGQQNGQTGTGFGSSNGSPFGNQGGTQPGGSGGVSNTPTPSGGQTPQSPDQTQQ